MEQRQDVDGLNIKIPSVVQIVFFVCALLAQWYGLKSQVDQLRIYMDGEKRIWEIQMKAVEARLDAIESRLNSASAPGGMMSDKPQ